MPYHLRSLTFDLLCSTAGRWFKLTKQQLIWFGYKLKRVSSTMFISIICIDFIWFLWQYMQIIKFTIFTLKQNFFFRLILIIFLYHINCISLYFCYIDIVTIKKNLVSLGCLNKPLAIFFENVIYIRWWRWDYFIWLVEFDIFNIITIFNVIEIRCYNLDLINNVQKHNHNCNERKIKYLKSKKKYLKRKKNEIAINDNTECLVSPVD